MSSVDKSNRYLLHFGREIYFQCQSILVHHNEMANYLASNECHLAIYKNDGHIGLSNSEVIRFHIESIVTHAANLSRIFFPANLQRAEKIRGQFQITKNSPLENRKLRNAFQHYDERIDREYARSEGEEVEDSRRRLTFISADSNGNFEAHWHDGRLSSAEAAELLRIVREISTHAERLLGLTVPPRNTEPFRPPPPGYVMTVSSGAEILSHAEYLRQTGQDPNTPYPNPKME